MKTTLIVADENTRTLVSTGLGEKYRIITAATGNEARLKYSNEKMDFIVVDMDLKGFDAKDFLENIRRKEELKNLRDKTPFLVLGSDAKKYQVELSEMNNSQFLAKPFEESDFKKKLLGFTKNSDVIAKNTRLVKEMEYLITENSESNEMFWVISGKFRITKQNQEGQNVIIGEVLPGELVGEMSFLDGEPRSASVQALEDSEVLSIPHVKFIDVLEGQPRWFQSLMRTLSQRLRNADKMIARKILPTQDD